MILVLQQLYWPSVWQRVEFKLAVLVCKALSSPAPQYLPHTWLPVSVTVCCQLWSSDKFKCSVFRTRSRSRLGIVHLQLATVCPFISISLAWRHGSSTDHWRCISSPKLQHLMTDTFNTLTINILTYLFTY